MHITDAVRNAACCTCLELSPCICAGVQCMEMVNAVMQDAGHETACICMQGLPEETVAGASCVWGWLTVLAGGVPNPANVLPKAPAELWACGVPNMPGVLLPPKLKPAAEDCCVPKPEKAAADDCGVLKAWKLPAAEDWGTLNPKVADDDWGVPKPPKLVAVD